MADLPNTSTIAAVLSYKIPAFYTYIGVGSAAVIANLVGFMILCSDYKLPKKSSLLFWRLHEPFLVWCLFGLGRSVSVSERRYPKQPPGSLVLRPHGVP